MKDEMLSNNPDARRGISSVKTPTRSFAPGAFDNGETEVGAEPDAASPFAPLKERDLSGKTLGGYELVRKIAEGGMGEVYEAIQTALARRVALKILTSRLASRPEFLHRFEREARAAAALNHPNVVQVYDFGEAEGIPYLIMEYVEGEDLADYVQRSGKLSIGEGLAVIEQAAQALNAACAKSIIHRDIKPANLLLTTEGRVKVSDMGLAKILTEDTEVTATGVGIGSPHFLAPEQADDAAHVDHRADIYALGITLLYLLTGKRPFEGTSAFSVVLGHANKPLPSGLELGTELPEPVEAFVSKMAAKKPGDRYQDYDALLADLERVKAGHSPVSRIGLGGRGEKIWRSKLPWLAGAVVVLIAAALVAWFWPRTKAVPPPEPGTGKATPGTPHATQPQIEPRHPIQGQALSFSGPRGGQSSELATPPGGRNLPFPILPRPDRTPLKDGSLDAMLAEAEAYAKANPKQFVKIIDRYWQLQRKAVGTPREEEFKQKLNTWVLSHELTAYETINQYQEKMLPLLQARKVREAYEVWVDFPTELRTPEIDQQIQKVLQQHLPPDFTPSVRGGPPARARLQ